MSTPIAVGASRPSRWRRPTPTARQHRFAWGASPNPTTANDGAQVYSNDEFVAAAVEFIDGVKSWDVVIRPVNGGAALDLPRGPRPAERSSTRRRCTSTAPGTRPGRRTTRFPGSTRGADASELEFSRTWQSQDLGPSVNGKYTIEITAYNAGRTHCGLDHRLQEAARRAPLPLPERLEPGPVAGGVGRQRCQRPRPA